MLMCIGVFLKMEDYEACSSYMQGHYVFR